MKSKKYNTVRTFSKFYLKIVETETKWIPLTHVYSTVRDIP